MRVNTIQLINFDINHRSADIVLQNDHDESYTARIQKIDVLMDQLKKGREMNVSLNYLSLPCSLVVDEIREDDMIDLVNNLLDEGDFFNVFRKI